MSVIKSTIMKYIIYTKLNGFDVRNRIDINSNME